MLLLWCLSMIQVFSYPLGERSFSSPWCSHSKQWLPLVAVCHLIMLRCFHKSTPSLFFSLLIFQQLRSSPFFSLHSFISTGGILISLSLTHLLVLSRSSSFLAYPFNRSVVSSFQFLFIVSSFLLFFNRSAVKIMSFLFLGYLVISVWFHILLVRKPLFHVFQPTRFL